MSVKLRQELEQRIAEAVIDRAIESGYSISVDDGEEVMLRCSTDKEAILKAMFTTAEDRLYISKGIRRIGWVFFVYGNDSGENVVNDYTTNLEPMMDRANALADKYSD